MIDMEKSTRSFSLKRIISSDKTTSASVLFVILFWALYLIFCYTGYIPLRSGFAQFTGGTFEKQTELGLFITFLGVLFFVRRIYFFHTLYKRGLEVSGIITDIAGYRVIYEYMFQNKKYSSGNSIAGSDLLKKRNYHKGYGVILLVDPEKPKNAVIKDIYF